MRCDVISSVLRHTLQAVIFALVSCQQPPLFSRHSFVSRPVFKQMGGSDVSLNPAHIAFRTAVLSNLPSQSQPITEISVSSEREAGFE